MNVSRSHILEMFLSLNFTLTVLRKRVRTEKESLCDCQFNAKKKGIRTFRTHGRFVPRRFVRKVEMIRTQSLDDSYPTAF